MTVQQSQADSQLPHRMLAAFIACNPEPMGLKERQHDQLDVDATDDWRNDRLSLFEGTAIETKHMKAEQADQVLTAAEIATLSISSGLVILSAMSQVWAKQLLVKACWD
ncbi:unnamed protein product [Sphagnum balticum]